MASRWYSRNYFVDAILKVWACFFLPPKVQTRV